MPYAPGITYQPFQANLGGWGAALMEIMGRKDQQKEQAKQEAKQFKTLVAYGEQIGLNKDELLTKDLGTVRGMVEGTVAKNKIAEEGERLKQLMGERTAREALQRAMQSAGTQQAPARQVPAMIPGQPGVTMMDLPAMQVRRKLTPEGVLDAMSQNPESFNAPQGTDLLRIMQSGQADPTREMFAESNLLNARANMLDAERRNTVATTPKTATGAAGLPPQPDFDPPEGYNWTFNGKAWQMTQPRGKTTGEALSEKLGGGRGGTPQEVLRVTKDGRKAIFDANTKQFLRYAD